MRFSINGSRPEMTLGSYPELSLADARDGLTFGSIGSKSGKKDTSLPAAIRQMAVQNPQTVDEVLGASALDCANIPELYTKYVFYRAQYAENYCQGMHINFIQNMARNPAIDKP